MQSCKIPSGGCACDDASPDGDAGFIGDPLSAGVGPETIKPFAVVIIDGRTTVTLLTLAILSTLYCTIEEWCNRKASS
jgi:Cu/Ag efflux pump CusA